MKLTNNTVLITGGSAGIGLALVGEFIHRGNTVLACARTLAQLDIAKKQFPALSTYQCDISDANQRQLMLNAIRNDGYKINVLINNAATVSVYNLRNADTEAISAMKKDIETNLIGPIELINELLPELKQALNSVIININSPAAVVSIAKIPIYSASKAGFLSYSRSLRFHLKKDNIKVIDVFPPAVQTAMTAIVDATNKQISAACFTNKLLSALNEDTEEIWIGSSKLIRFLAHFSSRWLHNWANKQLPLADN